jgi:hypothetical protein
LDRTDELSQKAGATAAEAERGKRGSLTKLGRSRLRERVHSGASGLLARSRRTLWYAESLVLAARYQQFIDSTPWAQGSVRYGDRITLWQREAEHRLREQKPTVLEFGVAEGYATQWWADRSVAFAAWHGFDTFGGLPADWVRGEVSVVSAGVFKPKEGDGALPEVATPYPLEWHRGLIQETLPGFERPDTPLFVIVDVDLLEPTVTVLDWLRENGRAGDLVYFDEAFDPWNEGKAIRQAIAGGLEMRAIAHSGSTLLVELT